VGTDFNLTFNTDLVGSKRVQSLTAAFCSFELIATLLPVGCSPGVGVFDSATGATVALKEIAMRGPWPE